MRAPDGGTARARPACPVPKPAVCHWRPRSPRAPAAYTSRQACPQLLPARAQPSRRMRPHRADPPARQRRLVQRPLPHPRRLPQRPPPDPPLRRARAAGTTAPPTVRRPGRGSIDTAARRRSTKQRTLERRAAMVGQGSAARAHLQVHVVRRSVQQLERQRLARRVCEYRWKGPDPGWKQPQRRVLRYGPSANR
jgi:hypothetical protein